jgi:methyl-accepting chemotaxis protein
VKIRFRFDDLSIRLKTFLAPLVLLVALLGLAGYTIVLLNSNEHTLTDLSDGAFQRAALVAALDGKLNAVHAHLYQLTSVAANDTSTERKQALAAGVTKDLAAVTAALQAVQDATVHTGEVASAVQALAKSLKSYSDAGQQVINMAAFDAATASIFMGTAEQAYGEAQKQIADLTAVAQKNKSIMVERAFGQTAEARLIYLVAVAIVSLGAIFVTWLASNRISHPVTVIASVVRDLASGNLQREAPYSERADEIGAIAGAVRVFRETAIEAARLTADRERQREEQIRRVERVAELARGFETKVMGVLEAVNQACATMQETARRVAATADRTSEKATAADTASSQASSNVQAVATATEELATSVGEIGRQAALSTKVAQKAVTEAGKTNLTVQGLAEASKRIGQVVELIDSIASQTNLLALNATIEAARAGEAGKGFAVVASEVKSLANQTAKATEEIGSQIAGMQNVTTDVVNAIDAIGGTITEIDRIAATIASAVEQQDAASKEIARNVQQAAVGTDKVSENIGTVTAAAAETRSAAAEALQSLQALSHQAAELQAEVGRFLTEVAAA